MKKKSLLVFLLALVSTASLGAAACKKTDNNDDNQPAHEHSWSYASDSDNHWQVCGGCNETKDTAPHVDADANGKCDVCNADVAIPVTNVTVTFDMNGNDGTAPSAQTVASGSKATQPEAPEAPEGFQFDGWFTDAAGNAPFDFNAPVTASVTVYAKWSPDASVAGYTAGNPVVLTKDNTAGGGAAFGPHNKLYFSYTLGNNQTVERLSAFLLSDDASQACTFAIDKNEDEEFDGEATAIFEVTQEDNTALITVTRGANVSDTQNVGVYITDSNNEPLPETWLMGDYELGNVTVTLSMQGTNPMATFNDNTYSLNYRGGSINAATFTMADGSVVTLTLTAEKTLNLYRPSSNGNSTLNYNLVLFEEQDPIDVLKFSGHYVLSSDDGNFLIKQIGIYENGNGYLISGTGDSAATAYYTLGKNGVVYDQKRNTLNYGSFVLTVVLDDNGDAVSIYLSADFGKANKVLYNRIGDEAMPEELPIEKGAEYIGENNTFDFPSYADLPRLNSWGITVNGFENGMFSVTRNKTVYWLEFTDGNDEDGYNTIKLYSKEGEDSELVLVDTLSLYNLVFHPLAATDDGTEYDVNTLDLKNTYYFKVAQSGWYAFTSSVDNATLAYNLSENSFSYGGNTMNLSEEEFIVYLEQGSILRLNSTFSFTIKTTVAPKGLSEEDPHVLTEPGQITVNSLNSKLYVKFAPEGAGSYIVKVTFLSWGSDSPAIGYTVDGTFVGYDSNSWKYTNITYDNPNYQFNVEAGKPVMIVVNGTNGYENVKVTISEDYTAGAKNLELVDSTPADGKLPATATVTENGTYFVETTNGNALVLTSSAAFTAKLNGVAIEVTNEGGVYTATIAAGTDLYVAVSATSSVTFTVEYAQGSEKYPYEIAFTEGAYSFDFSQVTTTSTFVYFVFTENCTFQQTSKFDGSVNGQPIYGGWQGNPVVTASKGDVLMVMKMSGTFTLKLDGGEDNDDNATFTEEQAGTYEGTVSNRPVEFVLNTDGTATYNGTEVNVKLNDNGTYSFSLGVSFVTFVFDDDGNISMTNSNVSPTAFTLTLQAEVEGTVYEGTLIDENDNEVQFTFTLSEDKTSGLLSVVGSMDEKFTLTITANDGNTYAYTWEDFMGSNTGTFTLSGNSVTFNDSVYGTGTLTAAIDNATFTEEQAGTYSGNSGYISVTFELATNGTAVYDLGMRYGSYNVNVTEDNGVYKFSYNGNGNTIAVTFTFDDDGNILLSDENFGEFTLSVRKEVVGTTYSGVLDNGDMQFNVEFVLSDDKSEGMLYIYDGDDEDAYYVVVEDDGEGTYSFEGDSIYNSYSAYGTFTISGDTIELTDEEYYGTGTLTKA